jgi:hypothetical protein
VNARAFVLRQLGVHICVNTARKSACATATIDSTNSVFRSSEINGHLR